MVKNSRIIIIIKNAYTTDGCAAVVAKLTYKSTKSKRKIAEFFHPLETQKIKTTSVFSALTGTKIYQVSKNYLFGVRFLVFYSN